MSVMVCGMGSLLCGIIHRKQKTKLGFLRKTKNINNFNIDAKISECQDTIP